MKNKINEFMDKLYEWYCIYENKAFSNGEIEISIVCESNTIDIMVEDTKGLLDELCLRFSKDQETIYNYIVIQLFKKIFNNVYIHKDGYDFYNEVHRPYLEFTIVDNYLNYYASLFMIGQKEGPSLNREVLTNQLYRKMKKRKFTDNLMIIIDHHTEYTKKKVYGKVK
jgi:hypothetical protein